MNATTREEFYPEVDVFGFARRERRLPFHGTPCRGAPWWVETTQDLSASVHESPTDFDPINRSPTEIQATVNSIKYALIRDVRSSRTEKKVATKLEVEMKSDQHFRDVFTWPECRLGSQALHTYG